VTPEPQATTLKEEISSFKSEIAEMKEGAGRNRISFSGSGS
jgi:hypothetical protein